MEEKKSFELGDDMLEKVSGGAVFSDKSEYRVGETVTVYCPGGCGGRNGSTGVITEIIGERMKIKMNCCGRELMVLEVNKW